jgi:hypothetical protein
MVDPVSATLLAERSAQPLDSSVEPTVAARASRTPTPTAAKTNTRVRNTIMGTRDLRIDIFASLGSRP